MCVYVILAMEVSLLCFLYFLIISTVSTILESRIVNGSQTDSKIYEGWERD